MKVTANAVRDGGWWVVEVVEVDGAFTQARRLDQVPAMVADAVSLLEGIPAGEVEVDLEVDLGDPTALDQARRARAQVEAAARAQEEAARASRAAVAHLRHRVKLSVRDTAVVLGVSPQRVSQLDQATA